MSIKETELGVFERPDKIVVIGDLHADYLSTIEVLKLAKVIELKGTRWVWAGTPGTIVVQLGDQVDGKSRDGGKDEDSDLRILKLFDYLDAQAQKSGSRVLSLMGNHELMAVRSYLDLDAGLAYAAKRSITSFGGPKKRAAAFRPGAEWGTYMSQHRYAVLKVGPFLFVHGNVVPEIADRFTIPQINQMVKSYLAGRLPWSRDLEMLLDDGTSLLWDRTLAGRHVDVTKFDHVLSKWQCKAIAVGHSPVDHITMRCVNKVWLCDTGISKAISGSASLISRCQVLDIVFRPNNKIVMSPLQAVAPGTRNADKQRGPTSHTSLVATLR
jgi:hypothetical protein